MKLSIDLADREEIAAAVPLLQLILDNTPKTCGGQCHAQETAVAAPVAPAVPAVPAAPVVAEISQDPAAVFGGGAAVPAPLAASTPQTATPAIGAQSAPATTAPITTTLGPASLGAGAASVELDKNGLPWDERIHAGTKTKLKSGEWKAKKQVDPALVAQVEAELRARVAASPAPVAAVPAVPAAPVAPAAPVVDPAAVFGGAAPGVPPAPAIPTAPPVAPLAPAATVAPSVSADPATFEQLMPRITAAVTAGIMPPTAVGAACAAHGVASVVTLQQSPQFVPLVWATLKQQYPALA